MTDLAPLAQATELTTLVLNGTQVSDLTPLHGLTKLGHLRIEGAPVSDEQVKALQEALPELEIRR